MPEWGVSAHPLIYEDKLICVVGGEGSTVVAFDKINGNELWHFTLLERWLQLNIEQ